MKKKSYLSSSIDPTWNDEFKNRFSLFATTALRQKVSGRKRQSGHDTDFGAENATELTSHKLMSERSQKKQRVEGDTSTSTPNKLSRNLINRQALQSPKPAKKLLYFCRSSGNASLHLTRVSSTWMDLLFDSAISLLFIALYFFYLFLAGFFISCLGRGERR